MTKAYELPNGHRMVADIDDSTRACNITETTLDSIVSKLNYYAEQTDVLDKIRADVINIADGRQSMSVRSVINILDKYKAESEGEE